MSDKPGHYTVGDALVVLIVLLFGNPIGWLVILMLGMALLT